MMTLWVQVKVHFREGDSERGGLKKRKTLRVVIVPHGLFPN